MPIGGGSSNGPIGGVAQMPVVFNTLILVDGVAQATLEIATDNLPGLNVWLLQTAGAGVVTATIQFGDGIIPVFGSTDWQPLLPAYNIASGVPSLVNARLGSNVHRVTLTANGGPFSSAGRIGNTKVSSSP